MDLIWEFGSVLNLSTLMKNNLLHCVLRNILVLSPLKCLLLKEIIINTVLHLPSLIWRLKWIVTHAPNYGKDWISSIAANDFLPDTWDLNIQNHTLRDSWNQIKKTKTSSYSTTILVRLSKWNILFCTVPLNSIVSTWKDQIE